MGANNRAFSAPCFLTIYKKATAEKKNAEQLLPVVWLRAAHEVCQILTHRELLTSSTYTPGAAKYQHCHSVQTNIMLPVRSGHRSFRTATKTQLPLPGFVISTANSPSEGGPKETSRTSNFCSNICSDVSEDFEVSCLFICFRSWDAV